MSTEMATSKLCSTCNKEFGRVHCTGCDGYFCRKDFKAHQDGMFIEMDKIVEERTHLQDTINNAIQNNDQQNPVIEQINQWQNSIIEKVNQVAAQARQQIKESENYLEHDLERLNQMISRFKQDLIQSTQSTAVKLHTKQSDGINWDNLIYVEEEQTSTNNQQQQVAELSPRPQQHLQCGGRACPQYGTCRDSYYDGTWKRPDGATCRIDHNGYYIGNPRPSGGYPCPGHCRFGGYLDLCKCK